MAAFDTHVQPTIAYTAADSAAPNATNAAGVRASGTFASDPVMLFTDGRILLQPLQYFTATQAKNPPTSS